jgi:hypothetical protein
MSGQEVRAAVEVGTALEMTADDAAVLVERFDEPDDPTDVEVRLAVKNTDVTLSLTAGDAVALGEDLLAAGARPVEDC